MTTTDTTPGTPLTDRLAGRHVLVLNWRDVRHPQAGGAEQYMHRIAQRWVAAGVRVTWFCARPEGLAAREVIDGITIERVGGELSLYAHVGARLAARGREFDAIVDCQNGIPFFAPAFVPRDVPVVGVVHHVHQDQFATRFPAPVAAFGRFLEGRVARRVHGTRRIAAVSPSTRHELRRRLGFTGPISVVPNGAAAPVTPTIPRDIDPTIAVVTRLVPHKRVDVLLRRVAEVARRVERLRVDVVGDGPERPALEALVEELGLQATVTLHGYQPDAVRDEILGRAWLTTSTSDAEGWGCSVIEAAAHGLPCVALDAAGIRDSVVDGVTGRLVPGPDGLADALVETLTALADDDHAAAVEDACRRWASAFSWDRSAELLAGVVLAEMHEGHRTQERVARADLATVARVRGIPAEQARAALRSTDQVVQDSDEVAILLVGCDEVDALAVLARLGATPVELRIAERHDLLAGPARRRAAQPVEA
ncbi:glycosyltransferase family 4 protein [Actinomycetospora cinnamomea]|uniref:Glycosyltransferase involved in cell wall biosynthesis n=1 Tax=Actinomycetospora cinnamomea TaxID=663609 RepID=A0A2U1FPT9_9PSEU|nr:glycosyltransferase family 4 protein [Actinomycetospora cinnamomea]PVZ14188.1 glycosyltransferase involved in cell wall biosynthesis [Actinomycetospora cinnamomea]